MTQIFFVMSTLEYSERKLGVSDTQYFPEQENFNGLQLFFSYSYGSQYVENRRRGQILNFQSSKMIHRKINNYEPDYLHQFTLFLSV